MTEASLSASFRRQSLPGGLSPLTVVLAAISIAAIGVLTTITIYGGPDVLRLVAQLILVVTFGALAFTDFRAAVAIALLELALGGASGAWTRLLGGWSGRQLLDAIVMLAALWILYRDWRLTGRLRLGRYGLHALVLAAIIPLVWMPLGLLNGHEPRDVWSDGNGHLFFAFTLVFIALINRGEGGWLRRCFLAVCAANAVFTLLLIALSAPGWVSLHGVLRPVLLADLDMGGAVGYMSNGAFRLYLGSGIYLQVGLALATWELLRNPRRWWMWALYAILIVDVIATYTRGFWLGTALAMGIVLLLVGYDWRRPVMVVAATLALLAVLSAAGQVVGFSLPQYVLSRSASLFEQPDQTPAPDTTPEPGATPAPQASAPEGNPEGGGRTTDEGGQYSNLVRATQASVLTGHIIERPIIGHGFGAIARDYPYAQIFSYELAFLDLAYKTGLLGSILFLSYPLRLVFDALRGRLGRLRVARGVPRGEMAVVLAILVSVLAAGATNPYILAAFGLLPLLVSIAWLEPGDG